MTPTDYSRYNRQILLPELGVDGQLALLNSSVLVVGAGGLGCPVLQYLATAGVGNIGVIDYDIIEESNLPRQVLYTSSDIGKLKVDVVAERLSQLNPSVLIKTYPVKLTNDNAFDIINDYDLVIDGSDNFPTRFLVNDSCVILNKPYVFGAIYQYEGQVSVFNYHDGPNYRSLVPEYPDSTLVLTCSQAGVLGVVTGVIGSLMACEAIKIITNIGETLSGRLLTIDTRSMQFDTFIIEKDHDQPAVTELADYYELCNAKRQKHDVKSISCSDLKDKLSANNDIVLVDIRDEREFLEYSIPGSINIPHQEFESFLKQSDSYSSFVLICNLGIKSAELASDINRKGNSADLMNLEGGIATWVSSESLFTA